MADEAAITATSDGRIAGIDGMLDQCTGSLMRQVRVELWPEFQKDTAMQVRVGNAIGEGMADELKPWVVLGAGALTVVAGVMLYHALKPAPRQNPRRARR